MFYFYYDQWFVGIALTVTPYLWGCFRAFCMENINMYLPEKSGPISTNSSHVPVHVGCGAVIRRLNHEHIHVDFSSIKSVGLANILDIDSHFINTVANSRSHVIKFRNGGEVLIAYSANGQLIDLSAKQVGLSITKHNELMFFI